MEKFGIVPNAKDILDICETGKYEVNGKVVDVSDEIKIMCNGTEFIESDKEYPMFYNCRNVGNFNKINIELSKEKTVDCVFRVSNSEGKVGVLNFASAKNPGGGFLTGAKAQEESLCYSSLLYSSLTTDEGNKYYEVNRAYLLPNYTDCMVYSPSVPFVKDSMCHSVPFVTADVLTCPAINRGALSKRDDTRKGLKSYDLEMKNRMFRILYEFKERSCKILVLGAFGCGVFDNDPFTVARNWYDLLNLDVFEGCFDKIVFAVFDRPPKMTCYKSFKSALGSRIRVL